MFWKKKPEARATIEPPIAREAPAKLAPDVSISDAILAYQRSFSESLQQVERADVRDAHRLVAEANKVVGHSGLGPALAPTLLDHVKYWPSWSKRDDFSKWVGFPATNISGEAEPRAEGRPAVSKITFTYNDHDYGVIFTDEGMRAWSDDSSAHGKVELHYQGYCVLGLDITQDLAKSYSTWRWNNVFAFVPGTWMKELTEMAAYIEAGFQQHMQEYSDSDALERARQIKL